MQIKKNLFIFLLIQISQSNNLFSPPANRLDPFVAAAKSHGAGTTLPRYGLSTVVGVIAAPFFAITLPINAIFSAYDIYQVNWLDNLIAYTTEGLTVKLARMNDLAHAIYGNTLPELKKLEFNKPGNPLNDFEIDNPYATQADPNLLFDSLYKEIFGQNEFQGVTWSETTDLKNIFTNNIFWSSTTSCDAVMNIQKINATPSKNLLFMLEIGLPTALFWTFLMGNIALTILDARVGSYIPQKGGKLVERDRDMLLTMIYFFTKVFDHYNFKSTLSKLPIIIDTVKQILSENKLNAANKARAQQAINCLSACNNFGQTVLTKLEYNVPRAFTTAISGGSTGTFIDANGNPALGQTAYMIPADATYWAWLTQYKNGPYRTSIQLARAVYSAAYAMFPWTAPSTPPGWFELYTQLDENKLREIINNAQITTNAIEIAKQEGAFGDASAPAVVVSAGGAN